MKFVLGLVCCLALFGCKTTQTSTKLALKPYQTDPLPPPLEKRKSIILPLGPEAARPLLAGEKASFDGTLLSERLAMKLKLQQTERNTLRKTFNIEREAFKDRFGLCNRALTNSLHRSKRSWWEENKGTLGFAAGLLSGGVLAVLLSYGLAEARP